MDVKTRKTNNKRFVRYSEGARAHLLPHPEGQVLYPGAEGCLCADAR